MELILPENYDPRLTIRETQDAIKYIRDTFQKEMGREMHLERISAPLFVERSSGLNDNLNGTERPVDFDMLGLPGETLEVVHSLAKWKRMALKRYHMNIGKGIYTDMNAIRRDEVLDNLHSSYVDQWDWEKIIDDKNRTLDFLKLTVRNIMKALKETEKELDIVFENLEPFIQEDVYFITTQELEDRYPELTPKQREYEITKQYKTVFIMQIGDVLKSGERHDGRAPDYDDWSLNGDILLYYPILDCPIEISSMGIRVNKESLQSQLKKAGCEERLQLPFHQMLMKDELPLTIGGGIGQSRICLILLNKAHIGEVQVSQWDDEMIKVCQEHHITLL